MNNTPKISGQTMDAKLKVFIDQIRLAKGLSMSGHSTFASFRKVFDKVLISICELPQYSLSDSPKVTDGINVTTVESLWVELWDKNSLETCGHRATITGDKGLTEVLPGLTFQPLPVGLGDAVGRGALWSGSRADLDDFLHHLSEDVDPSTPIRLGGSDLAHAFSAAAEAPSEAPSPVLVRTTSAHARAAAAIKEARAALRGVKARLAALADGSAERDELVEEEEELQDTVDQRRRELVALGDAMAAAQVEQVTSPTASGAGPDLTKQRRTLASARALRRHTSPPTVGAEADASPVSSLASDTPATSPPPRPQVLQEPAPLLTLLRRTAPAAAPATSVAGGGRGCLPDSAKGERDHLATTQARTAAESAIFGYRSTFPLLVRKVFGDSPIPSTDGLPLTVLSSIQVGLENQLKLLEAVRVVASHALAEASPLAGSLAADLSDAALDSTLAATVDKATLELKPLGWAYQLVAVGQLAVVRLEQSFSPAKSRVVAELFAVLRATTLVDPSDATKLRLSEPVSALTKALAAVDHVRHPFSVDNATKLLHHAICAAVDCQLVLKAPDGVILDWALEAQDCVRRISAHGEEPHERSELDRCMRLLRRFAEAQAALEAVLRHATGCPGDGALGGEGGVHLALGDGGAAAKVATTSASDAGDDELVYYLDTRGGISGDRVLCQGDGCRHRRPPHTAFCLACGFVDKRVAVKCGYCNLLTSKLNADGSAAVRCQNVTRGCFGLIANARAVDDDTASQGKLAASEFQKRAPRKAKRVGFN